MHEQTIVPEEVSATAAAALELHERLYPTKPVEEETDGPPAEEPPPEEEPQELNSPNDEEEETYKRKHDSLKGRFTRLQDEFAEVKRRLDSLQQTAPVEEKPDPVKLRKDEILAKLTEEYPEELIENLRALQRIEAEEVAQQYMQPIKEKVQTTEDAQYASAQQQFVEYLSERAPNWEEIWMVASEIKNGYEPSDEKIAQFLASPDPSGLYTNYALIHAYNNEWDADRMAILCNMYSEPAPAPQQRNFQREAMVAPSRVKSQPAPNTQDKKIWTMAEFSQFQVDARNDKYDEATKAALWEDVQRALAEGRIRG